MKDTDQNWKDIISSRKRYWYITRVIISEKDGSNPHTYEQNKIMSVKTSSNLFGGDTPSVGNCVAGEFSMQMLADGVIVPQMAKVSLFVSVANSEKSSEYFMPMGVYFVDTRSITQNNDGLDVLTLHGYDAMLKAEKDCVIETPNDRPIVDIIARYYLDTSVDTRTWDIMDKGYRFTATVGYSCREVLSLIASAYCGNFVITESGKLRLLALNQLPPETNYLVDDRGYAITFGGDRIIV